MTVALLARDLITASRIEVAAARAGISVARVEDPNDLPPASAVGLLLVDWGDREDDWGARIMRWCANAPQSVRPRVVLFGPHTDLGAHADARAAGLGPMLARSRLIATLPALLAGPSSPA